MDNIELTLRAVMIVSAVFVACGFGSLACEAIERAIEAGQKALESGNG